MRTCSRKALKTVMIVLLALIAMITVSFGVTNIYAETSTGEVTYLGKTYDTFDAAIDNWDIYTSGVSEATIDDMTIYLNKDVTVKSFVQGEHRFGTGGKGMITEIYINLNGHDLYLGNNAIEIINNCRMHITGEGSVITSGSNCLVLTYGSLRIEDTVIDGTFEGSVIKVKYGGLYFDNAKVNLESSNDLLETGDIIDINNSTGYRPPSNSHIDIANSEFNVKYNNLKGLNYEWNFLNGSECEIEAKNATMRVDIADKNHLSFNSNVINNYGEMKLEDSEIRVTGYGVSNVNSTVLSASTYTGVDTFYTTLLRTKFSSEFTNGNSIDATGVNIADGMLELKDSTVLIKADNNVCKSAYCVKYKNAQKISQSSIKNTRLICDCNVNNTGTCMYSRSSTNEIVMDGVYTYSQGTTPVSEIAKILYKSGYTNKTIDSKYLGNSSCTDLSVPHNDTVKIDGEDYTYTYTKDIMTSTGSEAKIGERYYLTIYDAFACAEDGDTIKLVNDINMIAGIEVNVSCTLDLNNHKIVFKKQDTGFDPVTRTIIYGHDEPYFTVYSDDFKVTGSASFKTEDGYRKLFYSGSGYTHIVFDSVDIEADVKNGYDTFIELRECFSLKLKNTNIDLIGSEGKGFIYCECNDFEMSKCNITYTPEAYGSFLKPFICVYGMHRLGTSNISDCTIDLKCLQSGTPFFSIISYKYLKTNNISNSSINYSAESCRDGDVVGIECLENETLNTDGLIMSLNTTSTAMTFTGISAPTGSLNLKNSEIYLNGGSACTCINVPSSNQGKVSIQDSKLAAINNNANANVNATCVANATSNRIVAHKSYFYAENTKDAAKADLFQGDVYVTSGTYVNKTPLDNQYHFNSKYYTFAKLDPPDTKTVTDVSLKFNYCVSVKSGVDIICSIGTTNYYDFKTAIRHVKNGQTIIVNPSIESYQNMETIDINSSTTKATDFTIDFQGSTKMIGMATNCTEGIHVGKGKTVTINGANLDFTPVTVSANIIKVDNGANVKFTGKTKICLRGYSPKKTNSVVMLDNNGKVSFEDGSFLIENLSTTGVSSLPRFTGIKTSNGNIVSGDIDIAFKKVSALMLTGIEIASKGESHLHEYVSGDIKVAILDCSWGQSCCIKDTGNGELVMDTTNGYFANNVGSVIDRTIESGKTIIKKGYYAQYALGGENKAVNDMFGGTFEIAGGYFPDNTLEKYCLDKFHFIKLDNTERSTIAGMQFGFDYRVAQENAINVNTQERGFVDDLVKTAGEGNTIRITQEDAEVNCIVPIKKNLTIDINQCSLSTFEDDAIFDIQADKTLTLMGQDASANCFRNENGAIAQGSGTLVVGKTNYYYKDKFVYDETKTKIKKDAKGATFSTDTTILCDEKLVAKKNTNTNRYEIVDGPVFFRKNVVLSDTIQVVYVAAMRNINDLKNIGFRVIRDVAVDSQPVNTSTVYRLSDDRVKEVDFDGDYKDYGQYQITAGDIAAKQIGDAVTFQVVLLDNKGGVVHVFHTAEYSAKEYAYYLLNTYDSLDDELKTLLVAMLEYSSYAQSYFKWKTDNLADSNLKKEYAELYSKEFNSLKCDASACPDDVNPVRGVGKQIVLGSTLSINFWIPEEYAGQYNEDDFSFTFKRGDHNSKFTSSDNATFIGDVTGVKGKDDKDLYCCLKIEGIKLQNIDKTFSLQVLDKNSASEDNYNIYKYSVNNYICDELKKTSDTELTNLLKSLYLFGITTQEYIEANEK